MKTAVRSAEKGRALGLGVLGWHTYLQQKGFPFEGLLAQYETRRIFSQIKIESERASYGSCRGVWRAFMVCWNWFPQYSSYVLLLLLLATASLLVIFHRVLNLGRRMSLQTKAAKGTFIRKNPTLVKELEKHKLNTEKIWDQILTRRRFYARYKSN